MRRKGKFGGCYMGTSKEEWVNSRNNCASIVFGVNPLFLEGLRMHYVGSAAAPISIILSLILKIS